MFWADELAARCSGPQVLNDSKTPSGTVHVGSLRGPVINDVIVRALRAAGLPTTFLYGIDDLDPMDAAALLTPDAVESEMGRPLAHVADPLADGHASYARHFAGQFIDTFAGLGIHPDRYYWMSEVYASGEMDRYIRVALDRAAVVRDVYRRVANVRHPEEWHPLSVICENCGRIGTTIVTAWDGERVHYECRADLVPWARGCGHAGDVSPFGGRAKMPFNVDWAARWSLFGVTIEPNGKDLGTKGGARDRSEVIAREVFEREPPLNVVYEFLNIGGRKMSTSKGQGAAAHEIADVMPPEQLRLLFLRPRYNQAIEFDPDGTDAIPRVFDESDRIAAAVAGREVKGELPSDPERLFAASQVDPDGDLAAAAAAYRPPFGHLALLVQIPGVDVAERAAAEKGAPLDAREAAVLDERVRAARGWLESYAPEKSRIVVHRDALPEAAAGLDAAQHRLLGSLADALGALGAAEWSGEQLQAATFQAAQEKDVPAGRAFGALYAAFLGQGSGPRAGWLLAALDRDFVIQRLREAAAADTLPA
jgi:lysyl-tRNA synthetase, class I